MTGAPGDLGALIYSWDLRLFHAIHPATPPSAFMLRLAHVLADAPLLFTAGLVVLMVLLPRWGMRPTGFKTGVFAVAALLASGLIGLLWDRPRPFMAGAGQAWLAHAATGSFPSNHLTLQWTVAAILLLDRRTRLWGLAVALLGLPMAWARVYVGVHYPGDMLGGLAMGVLAFGVGWFVFRRPASQRLRSSPPRG